MNYRKIKIFGGKKIMIRPSLESDIKDAKKFQNFFNSLVDDGSEIRMDKKKSLKEEKKWLKTRREEIKRRENFHLLAEHENEIIGAVMIRIRRGKSIHVGELGIMIKNGYRGIGLGSFMINEIIRLSQKELKSKPKIIRLSVTSTNKNAFKFYIKNGFKKVAAIPKQFKVKGRLVDEYIMLKYL